MNTWATLDFWLYDLKWKRKDLWTNLKRAQGHQYVLDNIPLGNDPKSRAVRQRCEDWIEYEKVIRPILLDQFVGALVHIIQGDYKEADKNKINWSSGPVAQWMEEKGL